MTARIQHNTAQRRDVVNPPDLHWAVRTFSGFSPDKSGEVSPISRLCAARGNERIKLKLRLQLVAEDVWKVGWGVDCSATRQHCTALYSTVHCTQLAAVSSPVSRLSRTITLSWTLATARSAPAPSRHTPGDN